MRAGGKEPPNRQSLIDRLTNFDSRVIILPDGTKRPAPRPLFAAALAEFLVQADPSSSVSSPDEIRKIVLGELLRREQAHFWGDVGSNADGRIPFDCHSNLFALATVLLGIELAALRDVKSPAAAFLPSFGMASPRFDSDRYARMSGRDGSQWLAPLQPDLLGEYFVLTRLHAFSLAEVSEFMKLAFELGGNRAASFLFRSAMDFPSLIEGLNFLSPGENANTQAALWFCDAQVNLTLNLPALGYLNSAVLVAQHARSFAVRHNTADFWLLAAMGTVNVLSAFGKAGDISKARDILFDLKRLGEERDEEGVVVSNSGWRI